MTHGQQGTVSLVQTRPDANRYNDVHFQPLARFSCAKNVVCDRYITCS